jgi:hypothetical protein
MNDLIIIDIILAVAVLFLAVLIGNELGDIIYE